MVKMSHEEAKEYKRTFEDLGELNREAMSFHFLRSIGSKCQGWS